VVAAVVEKLCRFKTPRHQSIGLRLRRA
jgi:hypothetical protein